MADCLPNEKWAGALHELAERRDLRLGPVPPIPSARREQLGIALAAAFPVEAALREAAQERDRQLGERPLPGAVTRELRRSLTSEERTRAHRLWLARAWPLAASLLAACGLLFLGRREMHSHVAQQAEPREGTPHPLSLRMSAAEFMAHRETLLAATRLSLVKEEGSAAQLRLDLPVQALFSENEIAPLP